MADNESKLPYTTFLRNLSREKFAEVFSASSRKARETYFHRHGVRASGKMGRFTKPGAKNEARIAQLFEVIQTKEDDEMAEEIARTYLLTKRAMLIAALDHLDIEHDNGLTESEEVSKFEKLDKKETRTLAEQLGPHASSEDITLYLKFMGVKDVDKKLS